MASFARAGLVTDHPPIVGFQPNAANPHYGAEAGRRSSFSPRRRTAARPLAGVALGPSLRIKPGMGFAGRERGAEVRKVWDAVRVRGCGCRVAARPREAERGVSGAALDDAARGVIRAAGFGSISCIARDIRSIAICTDRVRISNNFETATSGR